MFFLCSLFKAIDYIHGTSGLTYMPFSGTIFACEVEKNCYSTLFVFCVIIVICGCHCSWIIETLRIRSDVISIITVFLSNCKTIHYFVIQS